jgi:circadian clock protein KaiC
VITLLVLAQHGLVGHTGSPVDMTYLTDGILLLRFFEADGKLRRAISMVKKRTGNHEMTVRDYVIEVGGVRVGDPLSGFHGLLLGVPSYSGTFSALLHGPDGGQP